MAFVPLIIRSGPDTSSDRLRQAARCTRCGAGKGAMLMHPSYVDRIDGFQPVRHAELITAASREATMDSADKKSMKDRLSEIRVDIKGRTKSRLRD